MTVCNGQFPDRDHFPSPQSEEVSTSLQMAVLSPPLTLDQLFVVGQQLTILQSSKQLSKGPPMYLPMSEVSTCKTVKDKPRSLQKILFTELASLS